LMWLASVHFVILQFQMIFCYKYIQISIKIKDLR
jgi:hypothetical protein